MRSTTGTAILPIPMFVMLALILTGCFGAPERLNPMYKYYEKASKIDDFDERDTFLKSLSASQICEVVVLSRKNPIFYRHSISVAEKKGKHGLYGSAGCM